ncbi:E3 ubiquitin-protein ligase MPSR1-like [Vicia villosa]|uniref:E3 ubiquitin-protein ligase MPSR1-like n=1 Tax=Vicia villosa TaxID=3911 RepID=UPI00273BAE3F|nr:E3 ubiquitin-protein ligase MPSR1-like [Vicia villosa]
MASETEIFEHFSLYDMIRSVREMASEDEASQLSYLFERMIRTRDMSLFFPFMFRLYGLSIRRNDDEDSDQETERNGDSNRQRFILMNPSTQRIILINEVSSLETLLHELGSTTHNGQLPASKKSIDSMKRVEIEESDDGECVVCLEQFEIGGVVKEMPCKHKFHGDCIEKWLRIHGSCPVCRYQMPIKEKEEEN